MKNYVLHGGIHLIDNWYGQNFRLVLIPEEDKFFKTKKDAKIHQKDFKNYCKIYFNRMRNNDNPKVSIVYNISEREKLLTYMYCGSGPSYSCSENIITVKRLQEFMEREKS